MKRFLTFLALLLTFSVSAQTFQVATQIVASPDCKLKFLNKIDSQIYEVNSVDMTWQYLTTTTIKIKDYDNEVTVYKNNMSSPVFADIPALLDSVQGACMGGSGGGGIQSIVPGTNITVDDTDPQNPIVSSSGGGGVAGVESVNGKDGVLSIVAGSNVTIDDSRPDTIVISSSGGGGGDYEAGYGISINDNTIEVNQDVITVNGNDPIYNPMVGNLYLSGYSLIQIGDISFLNKDQLLLLDELGNSMVMANGEMGGSYPGGNGFDLTPDRLNFNHKIDHDSLDGNDVPQKWYVDSVAGGGGAYLPLNITDSTGVNLNGNSLIIQGHNHSLAINRPYDALSIGGAVMDGFQAQQYDSIYTMNGVMKMPVFFGDTIRYPMMLMSEGLPMLSPTFRTSQLKPIFEPSLHGFAFTHSNSNGDNISQAFTNVGFVVSRNDLSKVILDTSGNITTEGEVKGTSYTPKTSPYSYVQMQDIARVIITDPTPSTLINPSNMEVVVIVNVDSATILLPDTSDCNFWHLYIKNNSSTAVTVKTENDEVAFWEGGVLSDEYTAPAGTVTHIIFDGENYLIE